MPLLRNGAIDVTVWTQHIVGQPAGPLTFVHLSDYLVDPQAWQRVTGPWVAVVQPDDDLSSLPAELLSQPLLAVAFPAFTDGRGYSHARQLRTQHAYTGELIATGDIRRDQIDFMAQVGIDSFECAADIDTDDWQKALVELRVETQQ